MLRIDSFESRYPNFGNVVLGRYDRFFITSRQIGSIAFLIFGVGSKELLVVHDRFVAGGYDVTGLHKIGRGEVPQIRRKVDVLRSKRGN